MTVTIAFFFFSSLSLFERKKKMKTKQNKKTKPGKRNEKKDHRIGPFRLKWLQIFSRFVISKESASYTIVPSIN